MRRIVSVVISAVLAAAFAPAVARAAGPSIQDCPWPSFVRVVESNEDGNTYPWSQYLDSRAPGRTIFLSPHDPALRWVTHLGDVKPDTNAYFVYFDDSNGWVLLDHETRRSRDNGVIHQEGEAHRLDRVVGRRAIVRAAWTDECSNTVRDEFLGYVQITG